MFFFEKSIKSCKQNNFFDWICDVSLAKSRREQNLEIVYNNKQLYFKTIKNIFKNDTLLAFPAKDLEIALGLQFIPFNAGLI
jgi:hypothetical protein